MVETDLLYINERRKYLHKMRIRYWQVKWRGKKSHLVDEMVAVTGLYRKSILRLIHGELVRKKGEDSLVTLSFDLTRPKFGILGALHSPRFSPLK